MKKLSFYTLSLLLCGLTACVEDSELPAPPQAWDQEASKAGVSFSATAVDPIVLANVKADSILTLCHFTAPEGAEGTVSYEIQLDDRMTLPVDEKATITKADLQEAIITLYGKRPEARTIKTVATAFIENAGTVTRIAAPAVNLIATPEAPFIDKAYYLVGDMCGWDAESMLKFSHSGKDVYEDPIFSIIVNTKGNSYWKVIPQGNIDSDNFWGDGVLGCAVNGSTDSEGTLITANPQAAQIEDAGYVRITLNMMEYTYKVEAFNGSPFLYIPGNHQGWSPATAGYLYSTDMINYQGYSSLDGEFKFTPGPSWDNAYGDGGDGTLSTSGGNLSKEAGFYLLDVSLGSLTWDAKLIETYGLIGDATENGWAASTPMVFDAATSTYTITTTLKNGEFKFRANNEWDINLGGDLSNLTPGGDNIKAPEAGTYLITLDLSDASRYTCTLVKQ
ncbi:MAG: DUF5115 domain-containing protein [Bacteroidales bacterium]